MSRSIPPLDLMFLLTETPNSPKHVGALLVFDRPQQGGSTLVPQIVRAYRAATPVAPFNCVPEMIGRAGPHWKIAREIDLDHHVQHLVLPAGATTETVARLIEDLHEPMMDRNRPLFRVWAIEGLPGDQFALYLKIHHAIVDGVSALMRITASLSPGENRRIPAPFYAVEMSREPRHTPVGVLRQFSNLNRVALRQTAALKDFSLGLLRKGFGRLLSRENGGSVPFTAPHTPMNQPIRTPRSFATLSLPLGEMRAVGKAYGGTINDVAAAIVDAGAHAYLEHIGHPARKRLVAMCPVSLREADDKTATTKASIMCVPLGAPAADADMRMQQVVASINSAKDELRAMSKDAATIYALATFGLGEAAEASRINRMTGHLANFVLSNVPGSREQLHLNGAQLVGLFPASALGAGVGLNVTLASHGDTMGFGFIGNGTTLPHLHDLARLTAKAFDELKTAAARRAAQATRTAKAASKPRLARSARVSVAA